MNHEATAHPRVCMKLEHGQARRAFPCHVSLEPNFLVIMMAMAKQDRERQGDETR